MISGIDIFLLLSILLSCYGASPPAFVTVTTPLGRIQGSQVPDYNNRILHVFYGVPYAEPPQRFKKPQPLQPWSNTKSALFPGKICTQTIRQEVMDTLPSTDVSEDCLICDIYVPGHPSDQNNKAVIIWFMGGEFQTGQTGLLPANDVTLNGNVIFVSVAYRVGVFGFLSTGDDTIPGNFGLWDQKMAIEWVKANIKSFGGDPSRITLAGYEAGAISVSLQATNPQNLGNFQRILVHSTFSNSKDILLHDAPQYAQLLASKMCQDNSGNVNTSLTSQQIYDCLVSKSATELQTTVSTSLQKKRFRYSIGPVIDNDFILETTDFNTLIPVDVLISLVENENFLKTYEELAPLESKYKFLTREKIPKTVICDNFIPYVINLLPEIQNTNVRDGVIKLVCDEYTSSDETEQSRNGVRLMGDFFHYYPVTELLLKHSKTNLDKNTYLCLFAAKSPLDTFGNEIKWLSGSIDGDDLAYLFVITMFQAIFPDISTESIATAAAINSYWANFIKTGYVEFSYIKLTLFQTVSIYYTDRLGGRRDRDCMVVEFTTTHESSSYHH